MKLLLDAPEHLWRLIERKKYYPAAWLFLLARVVHRALVRDDDDQEEGTWSCQGVEVLVSAYVYYMGFTNSYNRNNSLLYNDSGMQSRSFGLRLSTRQLFL